MKQSRITKTDFRAVAKELNIPETEVQRAVNSFFDNIKTHTRVLPYDNATRIYSRSAFKEKEFVINIPFIGRIGTSYSRYLSWRANEAKLISQKPRSEYRTQVTQDDIEHIAEQILSGKTPASVKKTKGKDLYTRVWYVEKENKRLAKQVIEK